MLIAIAPLLTTAASNDVWRNSPSAVAANWPIPNPISAPPPMRAVHAEPNVNPAVMNSSRG